MSSELYHAELVARARQAFGEGRLPAAAASITLDNPLCGDRVTLDLEKSDGTVKAIGHEVKGCLLCAASAATIAEFGRNRSPAELREMAVAAKALMKEGGVIACEAGRHPFPPMHPEVRRGLIDIARRLDPLVLRWAR